VETLLEEQKNLKQLINQHEKFLEKQVNIWIPIEERLDTFEGYNRTNKQLAH